MNIDKNRQPVNSSTLLKDLGDRIRLHRLNRNMTQTQLAINCNFEKSSMSKIESGQINLSYITLYRISKGLDLQMRQLLPAE